MVSEPLKLLPKEMQITYALSKACGSKNSHPVVTRVHSERSFDRLKDLGVPMRVADQRTPAFTTWGVSDVIARIQPRDAN